MNGVNLPQVMLASAVLVHLMLHVCRQESYAADVQIVSHQASSSVSESLSFGEYDARDSFQPHAMLSAHANGSMDILSANLNMLPSNGTATVGSGKAKHLNHVCPQLAATDKSFSH